MKKGFDCKVLVESVSESVQLNPQFFSFRSPENPIDKSNYIEADSVLNNIINDIDELDFLNQNLKQSKRTVSNLEKLKMVNDNLDELTSNLNQTFVELNIDLSRNVSRANRTMTSRFGCSTFSKVLPTEDGTADLIFNKTVTDFINNSKYDGHSKKNIPTKINPKEIKANHNNEISSNLQKSQINDISIKKAVVIKQNTYRQTSINNASSYEDQMNKYKQFLKTNQDKISKASGSGKP